MASMTSMARARAINKKSKILAYAKPPFAKVTNKLYKKIAKWSKSKEKVTSKAAREAIINDAEGVVYDDPALLQLSYETCKKHHTHVKITAPIINYYRLQQYDNDGVYEIFGPISINNMNLGETKTVIKYINLNGQEIDPNNINLMDVYIEVYDDGTMRRVIK